MPNAAAGVAPSDCAELLVLIHDAERRVSSFGGEFEDWGVVPPTNVLLVDRDDAAGGRLRLRNQGQGLYPHPRRIRRRIWFDAPQRLRVELLDGGTVVRVAVRDGTRWWRWDHRDGTTSGRHDRTENDTLPALLDPPLLAPVRVLTAIRFEQISQSMRLERKVFRARTGSRDPVMGGQLAFELEFDAEYGTILRRAIFKHGKCVQRTEALEVNFGITVDPDLFVLEPR